MFLIYIYFFDSLDYRQHWEERCQIKMLEIKESIWRSFDAYTFIILFISALNVFTTYNKFLQRSDPLSYKLYPVTEDLVRRLIMSISTPQTIKNRCFISLSTIALAIYPLKKFFAVFPLKILGSGHF